MTNTADADPEGKQNCRRRSLVEHYDVILIEWVVNHSPPFILLTFWIRPCTALLKNTIHGGDHSQKINIKSRHNILLMISTMYFAVPLDKRLLYICLISIALKQLITIKSITFENSLFSPSNQRVWKGGFSLLWYYKFFMWTDRIIHIWYFNEIFVRILILFKKIRDIVVVN